MTSDHRPDESMGVAREQELLAEIRMLRGRVAELESALGAARGASPAMGPGATGGLPQGTLAAGASLAAPPTAPPPLPGMPHAQTPPPALMAPMQSRAESSEALSLEVLIGRRIVPLAGALAVLLAVGFLVKYAIDIGFFGAMPPEARFAMGILIGAGLLGFGEFVRRRGAPGAAVGLDAAGIGSLMITAVLGVYALELFGKGTGAFISCLAGVVGVAWSIRTQSVVVGAVALLGLFATPVGFDQYRESTVLTALQLALAVAAGSAMQLIGPPRFEAMRLLALCLALPLGAIWVATNPSSLTAAGFVAVWWAMFAAGCALSAIRGRARVFNEMVLGLTSLLVLAVHLPMWLVGGALGLVAVSNPVAWLAVGVGAALVAVALFLRSFDVTGHAGADGTVLDAEDRALAEASRACRSLASVAEPLAAVLLLGGVVVFFDLAAIAPTWAIGGMACGWLGSRRRTIGLELIAPVCVIPAVIAAGVSVADTAFTAGSFTGRETITLPGGATIALRLSMEAAVLCIASMLLFGAPLLTLRPMSEIAGAVLAAGFWIVACMGCASDAIGFFALASMAPLALGLWRAAPATSVWTALGIALFAGLGLGARMLIALLSEFTTATMNEMVVAGIAVTLLSTGLLLAATQSALARLRSSLLPAAIFAAGTLVAGVSAFGFEAAGLASGLGLGLVLVAAFSTVALVLALAAIGLRRAELALACAALGAIGIFGGSLIGLASLFESVERESGGVRVLGVVAAIAVVALLGVLQFLARASAEMAWVRPTARFVAGVALVPVGALLLASLIGNGLQAVVAAGWVIAVGVAELVVGFRRGIAPLRWAGLVAFAMLALRLYVVDLAATPMLLKVVLLFVSGIILVVTGIFYARGIGARPRGTSAMPPAPPAASGSDGGDAR